MEKIKEVDLRFPNLSNEGTFGKIYRVIFDKKIYAFKKFRDYNYLKGKIKKLDRLNTDIHEENLIIPKFFVVDDNNKIIGYLTDFFEAKNFTTAFNYKSLDKKISILKNTKDSILNMHDNKIIHGDLNPGNILLVNGISKIIDFDNCSYKKSKIKLNQINEFSFDFIKNYGINESLDIFLFNLITFSIINDVNFLYVRKNIYIKNYDIFNDNKDAIKICNTFFIDQDKPNHDFLIDTIDDSKII